MKTFVHPTAIIDDGALIGDGASIWHFCHVMRGACIGAGASLGQNVFVARGVVVGERCRVQNNVSLYEGVTLEQDVFLGPSCVLTNVTTPRAEVSRKHAFAPTLIRRGATIGANATIVCSVTIARYAFIAAGAVITRDVPDYALMIGVPARRVGWAGRHGPRLLKNGEGLWVCPESGYRYEERAGQLACLDLDEDSPLPR